MLKRGKQLLFGLIIVFSLFCLTACENNNSIIGSWEHPGGYVYTFNENMTGSYTVTGKKMEFTYKDDGNSVSILYTGNTDASNYAYRIEGKQLFIKDSFGNDVIYTRK